MAPTGGTENPDVALAKVRESLFGDPCSFDFFQAVRVLGWLRPDRSPVGRYSHPHTEVVRFGANPILHFPASAINSIQTPADGIPALDINFMGLIGPLGVLPNYVTELIAGRIRVHDRALLDFLNIFNHRLISFFYQAWEKSHFTVAYERDRNDPITKALFALTGFGTPGLRNRQPVEDETFIYYSGLFAMLPKSGVALEAMVGDYFDIPVEVVPFVGTWRNLSEPDQCVFDAEVSESTMLGFGAVVGDEVWDQQSRVRLKLGPLSASQFVPGSARRQETARRSADQQSRVRLKLGPLSASQYGSFLPTGASWHELRAMVRSFCGNDLEFEIQLILRREDVPALELRNPADNGLCLGWHTWLKSSEHFDRNPGDTILLLGDN